MITKLATLLFAIGIFLNVGAQVQVDIVPVPFDDPVRFPTNDSLYKWVGDNCSGLDQGEIRIIEGPHGYGIMFLDDNQCAFYDVGLGSSPYVPVITLDSFFLWGEPYPLYLITFKEHYSSITGGFEWSNTYNLLFSLHTKTKLLEYVSEYYLVDWGKDLEGYNAENTEPDNEDNGGCDINFTDFGIQIKVWASKGGGSYNYCYMSGTYRWDGKKFVFVSNGY